MNVTIPRLSLLLLLASSSGLACAAQGTGDAMRRAEERQMVEDTSPRAQYNRSLKEAHAAYAEALKECGKMRGSEKTSCTKEAKTNLNDDLAYAKSQYGGGAGTTSGAGTRTMRRGGASQ